MKRFFTTISIILMALTCLAQTPYSGGRGDGFASATLQFDPLALVNGSVEEAAIYPTPAVSGQYLHIGLPGQLIHRVVIHAANGMALGVLEPAGRDDTWQVPEMAAGLYFLRIDLSGGTFQYARLVISGR